MAKLYDTHCHLDLQKSRLNTLREIERHKIYTIAVTNLPPLYVKLKDEIDSKFVRIALGFHPELLEQYQKYISEMWELLPNAKYIGEVGIDLKAGKESKILQLRFFEELIDKCNFFGNKIITVHSRSAAQEVTSIIGSKFNGRIILHWYSSSMKNIKQAINNGYYFSVNYSMLSSKSGKSIIMEIPEDKLLIETDSPFISYGDNYDVDLIKKTIDGIAILKGFSNEQMNKILWNNFSELLNFVK